MVSHQESILPHLINLRLSVPGLFSIEAHIKVMPAVRRRTSIGRAPKIACRSMRHRPPRRGTPDSRRDEKSTIPQTAIAYGRQMSKADKGIVRSDSMPAAIASPKPIYCLSASSNVAAFGKAEGSNVAILLEETMGARVRAQCKY
jgi:hypothetical protein